MTSKSIYVNKAACLFLIDEERTARGFEPLSEAARERAWNRRPKGPDFMTQLTNDSFGGGNGTRDYRKWTRWDTETLKIMLKGAGFEDGADYWDGPAVEYINI